MSNGGNIEIQFDHNQQKLRGGLGSYSLEISDYWIILELHREEPTRGLQVYVDQLYLRFGTEVLRITIGRVLEDAFPYA